MSPVCWDRSLEIRVSNQFILYACLVKYGCKLLLFVMVRLGLAPSNLFTEDIYHLGMIRDGSVLVARPGRSYHLYESKTETANRELRNSEHRLFQLLEGMPLGVVVYGKDQKPFYLNKRTVEILSIPDQAIWPSIAAGRNLAQAIEYFSFKVAGTSEKYPLENLPVYRALHGEPTFIDDIEAHIGDRHIPLEIWASPVRDAAGEVESVVAVLDDITQRRQEEAELVAYRRHLEALVEMRTTELNTANEQLRLRLEWLSAAHKSHQAISGVTSLAVEYEALSASILHLLGARLVFILRWEGQREPSEILNCSLQGGSEPEKKILVDCFQKNSRCAGSSSRVN